MYHTTSLKMIFLLVLGFWVQKGESQVVISPEIGISYMRIGNHPHLIDVKNSVDFVIGLSSRIQFASASFMIISISCANRRDLTIRHPIFIDPEYTNITLVFKHSGS